MEHFLRPYSLLPAFRGDIRYSLFPPPCSLIFQP